MDEDTTKDSTCDTCDVPNEDVKESEGVAVDATKEEGMDENKNSDAEPMNTESDN
jgi:hypothetical protein